MSLFDKCFSFSRADDAMKIGMYPYFTPIQKVRGNTVSVDGKKMIMVGSNNYLGLLEHPKVQKAARKAVTRYGVATCGSRFLIGTLDIHVELEKRLAEFLGKEEALVFSTGFQTNLGIISTIAGKGDAIFADRGDHASIVDACRLSFADVYKFKHNDMNDLERLLDSEEKEVGKLIVVDGVFSMEGDLSNLPEIVRIAKKYDAKILVDDAHGVGVMGKNGRGTAEHFGLENEIDLVMGTFSKSFASLGGYVAGEKKVVQYIKHHARALMFSASMTPSSVATVLATLEIVKTEPERRERLWDITKKMKSGFEKMGYNTGPTETPIIPVIVGNDEITFMLWKMLRDDGIFTNPVIYPAVPKEQTLIRTSYSASHTDIELDKVLSSFEKNGKKLGLLR
ncbi:MAG: aminotransferase class I/II-fold pyridoxal phosphate-dependent enzyme [Candidatus Aminicenantes bacterium]|nr:aminotransferase class I/II-fold pyridoxal phosphate-dependent enzyme [Candidatus Aminicenantes bacterium]